MPAQQLHITLAYRERVAEAGTTAGTLFMPNGTGGAAADGRVIAVRVNGELRDLACPAGGGGCGRAGGAGLRRRPDDHAAFAAHVLAQAVQDLFPEAKLGIGPPIENGFYYDFDVPQPVRPR